MSVIFICAGHFIIYYVIMYANKSIIREATLSLEMKTDVTLTGVNNIHSHSVQIRGGYGYFNYFCPSIQTHFNFLI